MPLRYYVKSNLANSNSQEMSFLAILEVLNFEFDKFELFFKSQIYQNSNFRVSKIVRKAIFEIPILPKLSSRKMGWQLNS